jgi:hypothetical protein
MERLSRMLIRSQTYRYPELRAGAPDPQGKSALVLISIDLANGESVAVRGGGGRLYRPLGD